MTLCDFVLTRRHLLLPGYWFFLSYYLNITHLPYMRILFYYHIFVRIKATAAHFYPSYLHGWIPHWDSPTFSPDVSHFLAVGLFHPLVPTHPYPPHPHCPLPCTPATNLSVWPVMRLTILIGVVTMLRAATPV